MARALTICCVFFLDGDATCQKDALWHYFAMGPKAPSVELTTSPLVTDRVYMIDAGEVRDRAGMPLVHVAGAYTLNAVPRE